MVENRQIAFKVGIPEIMQGVFHQENGWNTHYLKLQDGRKISRVNIIGVVIIKEHFPSYQFIRIDDGKGTIGIRYFNHDIDLYKLGDIIQIIGNIGEYQSKRYVISEISKKIENKKWFTLRKKELENSQSDKEKTIKVEVESKKIKEEVPILTVYEMIKRKDMGEGVDFRKLLTLEEAESEIKKLLEEGSIFEIKPGKFKILE